MTIPDDVFLSVKLDGDAVELFVFKDGVTRQGVKWVTQDITRIQAIIDHLEHCFTVHFASVHISE